jgi:hypothetical protein
VAVKISELYMEKSMNFMVSYIYTALSIQWIVAIVFSNKEWTIGIGTANCSRLIAVDIVDPF